MADFSEISSRYEKDSLVQKSASEILFDFLEIGPEDDVLDLGCGTGHLSSIIRSRTAGSIVGLDPSKGMIDKAREKFSHENIIFEVCSAEDLNYRNSFDIIFCNSAFQWLKNPKRAVQACFNALRLNGKIAIQAPARDDYCPNFLKAIGEVEKHQATQHLFALFTVPWFFRNTSTEYAQIFEDVGFTVRESRIDRVVTSHSAEEAYTIFESGAAAGYLNPDYYSIPISSDYIDAFRDIVRRSFEDQANDAGEIALTFYRIYLLAVKTTI